MKELPLFIFFAIVSIQIGCNKNSCDEFKLVCSNGIKVSNSYDSCFCQCDSGWTSSSCNTKLNQVYSGEWIVNDSNANGSKLIYNVTIETDSLPYKSIVSNLLNRGSRTEIILGQNLCYISKQILLFDSIQGTGSSIKFNRHFNPPKWYINFVYYLKNNNSNQMDTIYSVWNQ